MVPFTKSVWNWQHVLLAAWFFQREACLIDVNVLYELHQELLVHSQEAAMFRFVLGLAFCTLCAVFVPGMSQAQSLPEECQEAQEVRSPKGQIDLLSKCLDTGRVFGREKATALKQRAIAYMHLGQHKRAIDDVNDAMKLNAGDADNYYLRGLAYRGLGNHSQSVDDSSRAIALEPGFAAAFANRAFSNKALGNTGQAKSDARRATDLDPRVKVPNF